MKHIIFTMGFVMALVPAITYGSFIITEVQYNPEGTDSGNEWIEVQNTSDTPQDLTSFFFRESGVNHKITHDTQSEIAPGGYAVIADNPAHITTAVGPVFDSSFSLLNSGELLELVSSDKDVVYSLEYTPEFGGNGDGSTLGLVGSSFVATTPTPGASNKLFVRPAEDEDSAETERGNSAAETKAESSSESHSSAPEPDIVITQSDRTPEPLMVNSGPDRYVLAHVPYTFKTEYERGATYRWNFGNGETDDGAISTYTYQYPGTYLLSLMVKDKKRTGSDTSTITVVNPNLSISARENGDAVTITNKTPYTVPITNFAIQAHEHEFVFPAGSYLRPNQSVVFSSSTLGFMVQPEETIILIAPGGRELARDNIVLSLLEREVIRAAQSGAEKHDQRIMETGTSSTPLVKIGNNEVSVLTGSIPGDAQGPETQSVTSSTSKEPTKEPLEILTAHAQEADSSQSLGLNAFDLVILISMLIMGLLFIGYHYHKKLRSDEFEDIEYER